MYSFADWRGEMAVDASLPDAVSVAVIDPDVTGRNPWTRPAGTIRPLPILPASEYRRFRNRLLTTMVPTTGTEAITVALGDQDITLYFDSQGQFHSTFSELPGDIRIVARYSLEDYLQTAPEILKTLLVELGVSGWDGSCPSSEPQAMNVSGRSPVKIRERTFLIVMAYPPLHPT
jgi:hypothetical protein